MRFITIPLMLFLTLVLVSCDCCTRINPTGPTHSSGGEWSPYVVVHTPGNALQAYQKVIPEMVSNGTLRGVRIGIVKGEGKNFVNDWIDSMVPDVLWILDNFYLFDQDIEQVIDQAFAWYPSIRYLQIGNEITTILPEGGPQMGVEEYMTVLKRIYSYVQEKYPGVMIVSQSTFGSGSYGSIELEKMVKLGLTTMSSSRLIVGMNVYSKSNAGAYSRVINSSLRGYRIWVTETGTPNPDAHVDYMRDMYPFLRNSLRAERIYWYALYCGDNGGDSGFGLIKNINESVLGTSPLYNLLMGR